jgi:peptidoglycan/LPS O-acetylase OafA/YrhL
VADPEAPTGTAEATAHDPALDGVRGLAVLLVMLFHLTHYGLARTALDRALTALPSVGWSGVDLFFVLSGYLITGILLETRRSSTYYRSFYARRVLRIFPLYYTLLVFFLIVVPRLGVFAAANDLWSPNAPREGIWYWLFLSNFRAAWLGAWDHQTLSLAWSLAIEEHFYLLWPAVVRHVDDRRLLWICGATIAGSLALRVALIALGYSERAVYTITFCRLDPLATGAAIAILARSGGLERFARAANVALPVAVALFVALCLAIRRDVVPAPPAGAPTAGRYEADVVAALAFTADPWMLTIGFSLLCVVFGALLVSVVTAPAGSWRRRAFSLGWLRALGKHSYALYLLHLFVGTLVLSFFAPVSHPGWFPIAVPFYWLLAIGASYAVARASWFAIEGPMLSLKRYFPYRT